MQTEFGLLRYLLCNLHELGVIRSRHIGEADSQLIVIGPDQGIHPHQVDVVRHDHQLP